MDIVRRLKQEFSGTALEDVADQVRVYVKERHEAADEIERLRKALQQIANIDYRGPMPDGVAIARRALGGSDDKD